MIRSLAGLVCLATAAALVAWLGVDTDDAQAVSPRAGDASIGRVESAIAARAEGRDAHFDALVESLAAGAELELGAVAADRLGELRRLRGEERRAAPALAREPSREPAPRRRDARVDVALARLAGALEPAPPEPRWSPVEPRATPSLALLVAIAALSAVGSALVARPSSPRPGSSRNGSAVSAPARRARRSGDTRHAPGARSLTDEPREDPSDRPAVDSTCDEGPPELGFGRILEISAVDE